jgi:hypothetical protein
MASAFGSGGVAAFGGASEGAGGGSKAAADSSRTVCGAREKTACLLDSIKEGAGVVLAVAEAVVVAPGVAGAVPVVAVAIGVAGVISTNGTCARAAATAASRLRPHPAVSLKMAAGRFVIGGEIGRGMAWVEKTRYDPD